jgi:hypothetical protein
MTTPRWFSRTASPPRSTRPLLASAFLAFAFATWSVPPAYSSDAAPEWLHAAAQEKLPVYEKDTNAVIVLDETQTTVRDNGEIDTLHRAAIRLLRPEARKYYGGISVDFDKDTKVAYLKAWTIEPNGHEIAVGNKEIWERGFLSGAIYEDVRVKELQFPEANPGSVVGFEYVQRNRPYLFENNWEFQDAVPVKTARFMLQIPPGWEFTTSWFNYPEQKPQTPAPNQVMWEIHDLPGVDIESEMPPWRAVAGWAGVKYFPRDPAMRAKTSGAWKDIGVWYNELTRSSRVASPQIKAKVAELTANISDPVEKMRVLTQYMQRNIRYFAVEIGIGGYQPHPAAEVFAHQYGDCKDKATLLSAMLQEAGIESYYVLIHTERGMVHPNYPFMGFNHAILAIRVPDGVTDPSLYAIVNHPTLGRLLIFDPTNEYVPLGYLPWYLQDNYGLVVSPEEGDLLKLPLLPGSTNRLLRTAKFSLSPSGDLSGEVHDVEWGAQAHQERQKLLEKEPSKRVEVFEGLLGRSLDAFTLTGASLGNLENYDQNLTLDYRFVSPGYAKSAGDMLILRPRIVGNTYTGLLDLFTERKPRKYPIEFEAATRQDEVFDITLPAGYVVDAIPQPVQADCTYATYHSEAKVADGVLHYKRTFEIKTVEVPSENLPEIRNFLKQVAVDQESSALLRRATP